MELSIARLVYEQADPAIRDSKAVPTLEQVAVSLPSNFVSPSNPNLAALENAMKQEGFMVELVA